MHIAVDGRNLIARRTGIARFFLEICEELAARGHGVTFYLPEPPAQAAALPRYAAVDIASFPGPFGRLAWSEFSLPSRVRRRRPHVFWGPAHRLPASLPRDLAKVVTIHDLVWRHAPATMRLRGLLADRFLMGGAIDRADVVCVDSEATRKDVAEYRPNAATKLMIVHPAVSMSGVPESADKVDLKARFGIDRPCVLFVGTNEPRKNLERLIVAFARLDESLRNRFPLVICGGDGWRTRDPLDVARQAGVAGQVVVTGFVTDAELAALYARARCLAMPSLMEGFGIPIVEAQRFSTPVLTSNQSSMPEAAGDGAILVDPYDIASIAGGLAKLLTDDGLHAALAARARKNSDRFSAEESARRMEQAFGEAIEIRRGRAQR